MFVLWRIYRFKRRCGLSPWQALRRALSTTLRDMRIYRSPKL
jgi:hypothetical protein